MRRLCERPGCGAAAEASYGIDQSKLVVWIDVLEVADRESAGRLCRRHADALEGPRGWTTDDRRQPVPTLFRSPSAPAPPDRTGSTPRPRKERKAKVSSVDTPSLFESIRRDLEGGAAATEERDAVATSDEGDEVEAARPAAEAEVADNDAADDGIDPDETKAIPWSPRLGRGSVVDDGDRPVFGRLLGRAFGEAGDS